jgi:Ras-related protein Rab-4B
VSVRQPYYITSYSENVNNTLTSVKKDPKYTVNVEFSSKLINIGDKEIKLHLWDTAGQERYKAVTKSYYTNAVGAIIVYDITK